MRQNLTKRNKIIMILELTLQKILFAILLTLPQYENDSNIETPSQHQDRLETFSNAIAQASHESVCENNNNAAYCWHGSELELSMLLISKAWHETRFSQHIHAGKCNPGECDTVWKTLINPKTHAQIRYAAYYKARSNWQIHRNYTYVSQEEWHNMPGTSLLSTKTSAIVAARMLGFSFDRCKTISGAISLYATGKSCKWSGARNRVWLYNNLLKRANDQENIKQILAENSAKD
jgi:hypothetical protein